MELYSLKDFDYHLPPDRIAQFPLANRDDARMLIRNSNGELIHSTVSDLCGLLPRDSLVIFNQSRVLPCRLHGIIDSNGKKAEIFLIRRNNVKKGVWEAIGKPSKFFIPNTVIHFGDVKARILERPNQYMGYKTFSVRFDLFGNEFAQWLEKNGSIPLPPYIKRSSGGDGSSKNSDRERYQTVYAREGGSCAAPTAGLHFGDQTLGDLKNEHRVLFLTLHVGLGTFMPVKTAAISDHQMHEESFAIPEETVKALEEAREAKRKIIAIGTTTFRAIETFYSLRPEQRKASHFSTKLFLHPNRKNEFRPVCDALFTNFHQPCSTLFMLVAALIGVSEAHRCYREALKKGYRFLSYGDASLFWLR